MSCPGKQYRFEATALEATAFQKQWTGGARIIVNKIEDRRVRQTKHHELADKPIRLSSKEKDQPGRVISEVPPQKSPIFSQIYELQRHWESFLVLWWESSWIAI